MLTNTSATVSATQKDEAEKIAFDELRREWMRPNLSRNDDIEVDPIDQEFRELRRERMRPFLGVC